MGVQITVGPHRGRKLSTFQTLPDTEELFIDTADGSAGISVHASLTG